MARLVAGCDDFSELGKSSGIVLEENKKGGFDGVNVIFSSAGNESERVELPVEKIPIPVAEFSNDPNASGLHVMF